MNVPSYDVKQIFKSFLKMRIVLFASLLTLMNLSIAGEVEWGIVFGSSGYSEHARAPEGGKRTRIPTGIVRGLASDKVGNTFFSGTFGGRAQSTLSQRELRSEGAQDILAGKIDPNGQPLWIAHFGGKGQDQALANCVDGQGNSFIVGFFSESITIGSTTLSAPAAATYQGITVAPSSGVAIKLSPQGKPIWAKELGRWLGPNESADLPYSGNQEESSPDFFNPAFLSECVVSPDGDLIASGMFGGRIELSTSKGTRVLHSKAFDGYVVKVDASNGQVKWAATTAIQDSVQQPSLGPQQWQSSRFRALSDTADGTGDVYVGGRFGGRTSFVSDDKSSLATLSAGNLRNAFVGRISSEGKWRWVRAISSTSNSDIRGVDALDNDVIAGGFYAGQASLGDIAGNTSNALKVASQGLSDAMIVRLDGKTGAPKWIKSIGGVGREDGLEIAVLPKSKRIAFAGSFFSETLNFNKLQITSTHLPAWLPHLQSIASSARRPNWLVGEISADGEAVCLQAKSGSYLPSATYAITALPDDSYSVGGFFVGRAQFGGIEVKNFGLNPVFSNASDDGVVVKLKSCSTQ